LIAGVRVDGKIRIQTLREQGLVYRAIAAKYPEKNRKLDRAPATNCSDFTGKEEWPLNSPDLNPLD